jgi:uncharacterized damage-inducible protein DinB
MLWSAPHVDRPRPPNVADERTAVEAWLDYHRNTLLHKCSGLETDQLRRRAVDPSNLSLLGLVRHMTEVERSWFRRRFAGDDIEFLYCSDANPDGDFDDVDEADAEREFTAFVSELALVRQSTAGHSLDETFQHPRLHVQMDLRWIYLHMIEEYARHNGHADLLRESIDGATGE